MRFSKSHINIQNDICNVISQSMYRPINVPIMTNIQPKYLPYIAEPKHGLSGYGVMRECQSFQTEIQLIWKSFSTS